MRQLSQNCHLANYKRGDSHSLGAVNPLPYKYVNRSAVLNAVSGLALSRMVHLFLSLLSKIEVGELVCLHLGFSRNGIMENARVAGYVSISFR
jgi:hypothetical protein